MSLTKIHQLTCLNTLQFLVINLFLDNCEATHLHIGIVAILKCASAGLHTMYKKDSEHTKCQERIENISSAQI